MLILMSYFEDNCLPLIRVPRLCRGSRKAIFFRGINGMCANRFARQQ